MFCTNTLHFVKGHDELIILIVAQVFEDIKNYFVTCVFCLFKELISRKDWFKLTFPNHVSSACHLEITC